MTSCVTVFSFRFGDCCRVDIVQPIDALLPAAAAPRFSSSHIYSVKGGTYFCFLPSHRRLCSRVSETLMQCLPQLLHAPALSFCTLLLLVRRLSSAVDCGDQEIPKGYILSNRIDIVG